ncbi:MAG: hypothetical protein IJ759_00945 [Bacteroidales bacterium]|nr:hypothetical protein [Bacteroidales bacterium]
MLLLKTRIVFNEDIFSGLLSIVCACLAIGLVYLFYFHIPIKIAHNRGRSGTVWVILSFILSPIWVYIILAIIGDSKEKIRNDTIRMMQERELSK